ncbi:MAG: glycosyltransferase [Hyphomicrobiaceae bacterium]
MRSPFQPTGATRSCSTLATIFALEPPADEILVLDQTVRHDAKTEQELHALAEQGRIRHIRLQAPSIPVAMNVGLARAEADLVLFLDDDVVVEPDLISAHIAAHRTQDANLVAGRVIQPWQEGVDYSTAPSFHFATTRPAWIDQFMGGNFSVDRKTAISLGGFDENFVRVAYNFEAEFAYRYRCSGRRIYFEPAATIHHLKIPSGGTRTFGEHLRTSRPDHAVGAYYYVLRTWSGWRSLRALMRRPIGAIATRHHIRRPWWVPMTLLAEFRGLMWAIGLAARGPKHINPEVCNAQADAGPR